MLFPHKEPKYVILKYGGIVIKPVVINFFINIIKKNKPATSKLELEKIRYGLEGVYLTIFKFIIILGISLYLNVFTYFIIFLIFYNIIRMFAFGFHASKSFTCLVLSSLIFIVIPYLASVITINFYIKIFLCIYSLLMIILFAPADTKKRPLKNKKKRFQLKIISIIITLVYIFIILINNSFIANIVLFSLLVETLLISPIIYIIFKMPYKNYNC